MEGRARRASKERYNGNDYEKINKGQSSTPLSSSSNKYSRSRDLKKEDINEKGVKLYVGNLPEALSTTESLKNYFIEFGEVVNAYVVTKEDGYKYGFVFMKTMEQAENAIDKYNDQPPYELIVKVAKSKPNSERSSSLPRLNYKSPVRQQNHQNRSTFPMKKRLDIIPRSSIVMTDSSLDSDDGFHMVIQKTDSIMPCCSNCSKQCVKCDCGQWYCSKECKQKDLTKHRLTCPSILSSDSESQNISGSKHGLKNADIRTKSGSLNCVSDTLKDIDDDDRLKIKRKLKSRGISKKTSKVKKVTFSPGKADTSSEYETQEDDFKPKATKSKESCETTNKETSAGTTDSSSKINNELQDDDFNLKTVQKSQLSSPTDVNIITSTDEVLNSPETTNSSSKYETQKDDSNLNLLNDVENGKLSGNVTSDNKTTISSIFSSLEDKELWELLPELIIGKEVTVVVRNINDHFAWVTDVLNDFIISYIQQFINYYANKSTPLNIAPGKLCLVNHENEWYRGVITDINSSSSGVRLLDFGKSIVAQNDTLFEVVDTDLRTEPAFAVKVCLAPRSTIELEEGEIYQINATKQIDNYFEITVKDHEPIETPDAENKIKSPIDFLQAKSEGILKIEHRFCSNEATASFETSAIEKLTASFISARPEKQDQVQVDDMVLVNNTQGQEWERGKVVKIIDGKYVVSLCDLGRVVHCNEVYHLPEKYTNIPPQSCNLKIINFVTKDCARYIKFIKKFVYKVVQTEPNIEITCSTENKSDAIFKAQVNPWSPNIGQYGPNTISIAMAKSYKNVQIFEVENVNTVYVMNQDKIFTKKYNALLNNVQQYSKTLKAKHLIALPLKNEMVLSQCAKDKNFYRAIVEEVKHEHHIKVVYTEFGNTEIVAFDKLRELSDDLKTEPIFLLKVELFGVPKVQSYEALLFLAEANQIFTMKIVDEVYPMCKLFYQDMTTLNDKINNIITESKVILLNENTFLPITVGSNAVVFITNSSQLESCGEVYGTISNIEDTDFLKEILEDLHKELNLIYGTTTTSHKPITNEVCVAYFPEDSWGRALCVETANKAKRKYLMQNLDCGGTNYIKSKYIRKMDKKFLSKPYLASKLTIEGLTCPVPSKQLSVLKNHFDIGNQVSGYLTKLSDGHYTIKLNVDLLKQLERVNK